MAVRMMSRATLGAALAAMVAVPAQAEPPVPPSRPAASLDLPLPPETAPPFELFGTFPKGRSLYLPLAAEEARRNGLPAEVADAVMRVESGYDPGAVGGVGERGLMQVLPSTATMLGHRGTLDELAEPATNVRLGVRYLAGAWRLAGGDLCRTLMKYRAGHNETRMSALSVEYCRRAKLHLASIGSPLADGTLPPAEFGLSPSRVGGALAVPGPSGGTVRRIAGRLRRVMPVRTAATSRRFWAAHTARVRAIEARLPWRRGGIMVGS